MKDISPHDIIKLEEMFGRTESPVIVTHMRPDGDAIGSSAALYHFLKSKGKRPVIALNDRQPSYLDFLIGSDIASDMFIYNDRPDEVKRVISSSDLIICLDFNSFHRTDNLEDMLSQATAGKVLIDHHLNPDRNSFNLIFSETEVSSASELLYHVLMSISSVRHDASELPPATAEALMTGMTTDTNNFANSVFPSTLNMASALLAAGVDRDRIISCLYNQLSESRLRLMGHAMKDLLKITDDGVAYIVLDSKTQKEYDVKEGDTEGFVNMPLSIADVRMSLFLKEDGDRIRVSIRSKKGTSANMCARIHFNGGGHENAAGGKLRIPDDIKGIDEVAGYIERHTHIFLNEDEKNN